VSRPYKRPQVSTYAVDTEFVVASLSVFIDPPCPLFQPHEYETTILKQFDEFQKELKNREQNLSYVNLTKLTPEQKKNLILFMNKSKDEFFTLSHKLYTQFEVLFKYLDVIEDTEHESDDLQDKKIFQRYLDSLNSVQLHRLLKRQPVNFYVFLVDTPTSPHAQPDEQPKSPTVSHPRIHKPTIQETDNSDHDKSISTKFTSKFEKHVHTVLDEQTSIEQQIRKLSNDTLHGHRAQRTPRIHVGRSCEPPNKFEIRCVTLTNRSNDIHTDFETLRSDIPTEIPPEQRN
jgi:hypothetical protein